LVEIGPSKVLSMRKTHAKNDATIKHPERGSSLIEYGILCALIAFVAIVAVRQLGRNIRTSINESTEQISDGAGLIE
jgi:Flp pilus assembly pilin Flp